MPAKAFSAPGPYCIAKTPGGLPLVTRAQPSAMWTPTRSWRQITGRTPAAAAASMIGVVGKQNRVEMPSRFRISVIASMTSIGVAPLGCGGVIAEPSSGTAQAPASARSIPGWVRLFHLLIQEIYRCSPDRDGTIHVPQTSRAYNTIVAILASILRQPRGAPNRLDWPRPLPETGAAP